MTTNQTTDPTAWRPAYEGERCDCGEPAVTVFVTERWGDVPYCGVPHAGDHPGEMLDQSARAKWVPPRTEERVVVIPEVTASVTSRAARERALELVEELRPKIEELHACAMQVRDDADAVLVALYPIFDDVTDETTTLADKATGWDEVWEACRWIGDRFSDGPGQGFSTVGLELHEIARGGERDFPVGTVATVPRSDGLSTIRAKVQWGPRHPLAEGGYIVRDLETGKEYICTHEQIKAGLEEPAPAE